MFDAPPRAKSLPPAVLSRAWTGLPLKSTTSTICNYRRQNKAQLECSTVRAPVFGRHQFFGTSEHYGKAHGILFSGWMNYNYTTCRWFPTSSNIFILPSQFWQIRFESYWLHCSKCRILVLLRCYFSIRPNIFFFVLVKNWVGRSVIFFFTQAVCPFIHTWYPKDVYIHKNIENTGRNRNTCLEHLK